MRPRDWAGMSRALIAPMPCADQAELLRAFDLPIALMQDAEALERITAELVETKAADGVRYVEIRWGPLLHVARRPAAGRRDRRGLRRGARRGRAGPATTVRLICTALRSHDPAANVDLAETAARFRDRGLTGWDLAGPEEALPGPAAPRPRRSRSARAGGLRITLHAGEWGGAAQVRRALAMEPGADRPRPGRHRRSRRSCAELIARRRDARPVPDLELAGRDRADRSPTTRSPGCIGPACR